MALSAAARAALEQFKTQQANSQVSMPVDTETPIENRLRNAEDPIHTQTSIYAPKPESTNWNRINDPSTTIKMGGLFRPEQPKTFKESGISYRVLEGLILKIIKQEGPQNEAQIAEIMKVSVNVFRDILISLNKRELLDTPMPLHYDLTTKGRDLVAMVEREDAYIGPAPVPFNEYVEMVKQQAKRERRVTMPEVEEVFAGYPMRDELKATLKEGFNSQRVMIFYGPPGNGKSLITDNLHRLLREPVLLPYAFEYNSKVVTLYDPAFHKICEDLMTAEEKETAMSVSTAGKPDRRWLISEPPLVTVGTEFKVAQFDITYDGQYWAPPHMKANNGIFIFDDLGRQTEDHNMILNQFIYPLEHRAAIIRFAGGSSMRAPFLQRLFLSTNLNHEEILDDAFKRRLLYQVLVDRPTTKLWKQIFVNESGKLGIDKHLALELSDTVVHWYKDDDRVFRACDPRNLMVMLDASLDAGQKAPDVLDLPRLRDIYERYPAAHRKDAKFFVGAMDSTGQGDEE
jgi:predicted transcriptional regulator